MGIICRQSVFWCAIMVVLKPLQFWVKMGAWGPTVRLGDDGTCVFNTYL